MIDKLLICTDLDRTLIPNGMQPESPQARQLFRQLVGGDLLRRGSALGVILAYVTGRDRSLVLEAIQKYQLPLPDFVIADVGSTIYQVEGNDWLRLEDWDAKIAVDWQHKTQQDLVPLFSDLKQCRLQEEKKQGLHKLSYYVSLDTAVETLMAEMYSRLEMQQIQANLIWSIDEQADVGLLDVLPRSANKRLAIEFLMARQHFTLDNTVFSGDSGNDLAVLVSPIKTILVANASEELKEKVKLEAQRAGLIDSLYIAKGIHSHLNGNYSAGILEGISYYFPEIENWLQVK